MLDNLLGNQSIILSLDVDNSLFERLQFISELKLSLVEINSTDTSILTEIIKTFPKLRIGASHIINLEQLEKCHEAAVHFATSPGFLPSLAKTASVYSMNYLPGIATISEAMQVMELGYKEARPFPSKLSLCSLLNTCIPNLRLIPSHVEWEDVEHYLNLPNVAAITLHNPEKKQVQALSAGILA